MSWFSRKKPEPAAPAAPASPPATTPEEEREETIARVYRLLTDEAFQNQQLPPAAQQEMARAPAVDEVPGGRGEFGRSVNNPIPVNGPLGAVIYLSSLVTDGGQPIAFQRLGAPNSKVELFESVSLDGRQWDCLYLTLIFPRKSTRAPKGFRFAGKAEKSVLFRGFYGNAEDFPLGIFALARRYAMQSVGAPVADPRLTIFETARIDLPEKHRALLQQLRFGATLAP